VESLVSQIVTALQKMKDILIILTSRLTENQIKFPHMSRVEIHVKKEFDGMKLNLSIYNMGKLKQVFIMENELNGII
jgi:hypothetical protein